ncbi:stage II sporulation protein M [Pseudomonas typographi]|uniref:stage II sporulation protein M n=1 Tax=Pseudomonas typographi TaxID=2715964 RepID=UPI001687EC8B|nr:stage II sporulation protein M [Pseudomonas typographi]MBD1550927.1 stage II sporulation protein M [Pseudomonas typographi]MBD1585752.1 stage II sporulation protein M [Pseudomonas typographi]
MKQRQFEASHQRAWAAFEAQLGQAERAKAPVEHAQAFGPAYRRLCSHLALAQERQYTSHLIDRLQHLALRGHQQLYRHQPKPSAQLAHFLWVGFPRQVRAKGVFVLLAAATLFGTLALVAGLVYAYPELAYSVLPAGQLASIEQMYSPAHSHLGRAADRQASADWVMFCFYVMNNIGIAFQTFASGLLVGLGSLFYLFYNGLQIGVVAGHVSHSAAGLPFWSFVIGHGAFELTAITLAGAAGLQLGWALIAPGPLSRGQALRQAAKAAVQLVYGVVVFLLVAALLEAYWSAKGSITPATKFAVGAALWAGVLAYLLLAGRTPRAA